MRARGSGADRDFKTIDFLTLLDLERMAPSALLPLKNG